MGGNIELRHDLSIWGGSPDCRTQVALCTSPGYVPPSLVRADPAATVVRAQASGEWHPLDKFLFSLDLAGQWASGPAVAFEQFTLGNYTVGRGYSPGALTGDDGFSLQGEVKPYAFSDNGWVWTRAAGGSIPNQLHSAGAGLRLVLDSRARLDTSVAVPLTTLPGRSSTGTPLFLMTLSTTLQPGRTR
jgi:hemolysin activation/secretion protein